MDIKTMVGLKAPLIVILNYSQIGLKNRDRVSVFLATFNNISVISWQSIAFVEETGVPGENHRPAVSH